MHSIFSLFFIFLGIISKTFVPFLQNTRLASPAPWGAIIFLQFLKIDIWSIRLILLNCKILNPLFFKSLMISLDIRDTGSKNRFVEKFLIDAEPNKKNL